ncbi:hypothetical protein BKI52_07305 [marine bacterium AO1-C]|nr:hypothetical protein BKI52_07305 [marine bacterium AO1-C]
MKTKTFQEKVDFYQERFGYQSAKISSPLPADTQIIVVIPCFDEPDLVGTLESLAQCTATQTPVEVIVVVNQGVNASSQAIAQNQKTIIQATEWMSKQTFEKLSFHLLEAYDLPKKYAGVGLARKIGMDEALYRFGSINYNGGIVCLDADCRIAPNYLVALEQTFAQGAQSASIFFEHRLDTSPTLNQGILQYELFLRYYVAALRFVGYPYAYHTIGSSMAVCAETYAISGGMNRRKAGEDFYFLHKVAPLGKYYEIAQTAVYPSSRTSHRVPFGTGKAQQKWLDQASEMLFTYDPQTFVDLQVFLNVTRKLFKTDEASLKTIYEDLPASIQAFFAWEELLLQVNTLNKQTAQLESFLKRWFHWLDGLKVLKYVHFARDEFYPEVSILEAAEKMLNMVKPKKEIVQDVGVQSAEGIVEGLLAKYRAIDRAQQGWVDFMQKFV